MEYNGKQVKGVKRQERHARAKHGMVVTNRSVFTIVAVIGKKAKVERKEEK